MASSSAPCRLGDGRVSLLHKRRPSHLAAPPPVLYLAVGVLVLALNVGMVHHRPQLAQYSQTMNQGVPCLLLSAIVTLNALDSSLYVCELLERRISYVYL